MPSTILLALVAYGAWLCVGESRRRVGVSGAIWVVVLWVALLSTRPISMWFGAVDALDDVTAYDEGSPADRFAYLVLLGFGLIVLARRGVRPGAFIVENRVLFVLMLYWGASGLWSDLPALAFKRWLKDLGNIVMVLVVLTERNPAEAMKALFARTALLLVPLSLALIRYQPALGRMYHSWTGEMMYVGVATHKNSLGAIALVVGLFLLWSIVDRRSGPKAGRALSLFDDVALLLLTAWLLVRSNSATALACAALGGTVLLLLRRGIVRSIRSIELFAAFAALMLWLTDLAPLITRFVVVDIFERDLTLTTRTDVWPLLWSINTSPILGAGFNSFWSGERLGKLYTDLGIIQAHNGYLETLLNGGVVGAALLALLLVACLRTINRELTRGTEIAAMSFVIFLVTVVYNFTEAAFNKMSPIWFAFLLAVVRYPPVLERKRTPRVNIRTADVIPRA